MSKTILAENLGPISNLEFSLKGPGVTVLVAPNGSGKTILLEAVQAAARGEGKLPLRDRTRRGRVEAFGATITIGGTCRHTGGFEVTNLEGRFDLDALVDPRLKTPSVADNARIKALVSLTGAVADAAKFKTHEALASSYDSVVKAGSTETEDLVEMARKIKDDYDKAARSEEDKAERETGHAKALVAPADLDLEDESDPKVLQDNYDEARDLKTRLESQAENAGKMKASHAEAKKLLDSFAADELVAESESLTKDIGNARGEYQLNVKSIEELERQIDELRKRNTEIQKQGIADKARVETITRQLELVATAQATIESATIECPTPEAIAEAVAAVEVAQASIERGTLIRQARKDAEKSAAHRKAATAARALAVKYRDAGKATDEVLSSCIKCEHLRVESDGKAARLVTDSTDRGKSVPYHDLSDGEKWTIAIDIGADQVGEGGLLTVTQIGWEGIDADHRSLIHKKALERGVYVLTLEASRVKGAPKTIVPTPYDDSAVPVAEVVDVPESPPEPPEPKRKVTPKAKEVIEKAVKKDKETPLIHPDVDFTDEDIPF